MLRIVFVNGLWITGLAIIVAALSYHRYQAIIEGLPLRQQLGLPSFQLALYLGMMFVGLGLAGTSAAIWETVIWIGLVVVSAVGVVRAGRSSQMKKQK